MSLWQKKYFLWTAKNTSPPWTPCDVSLVPLQSKISSCCFDWRRRCHNDLREKIPKISKSLRGSFFWKFEIKRSEIMSQSSPTPTQSQLKKLTMSVFTRLWDRYYPQDAQIPDEDDARRRAVRAFLSVTFFSFLPPHNSTPSSPTNNRYCYRLHPSNSI